MKKIQIKTPSRLHLGFLNLRGDFGRIYGSLGIGIDKPNFVIDAEISDSNSLEVMGLRKVDVKRYAEIFLKHFNLEKKVGVKINVSEEIPKHIGLGSGTQLALGVGFSLAKLFKKKISVENISEIMKRGKISGAGTYIFKHGGFVVDAGKKINNNEKIPPLLFHHSFPKEWFFVVVVPNIGEGFHGKKEKENFKKIQTVSKKEVKETFRLVWMKMIPALIEKDISSFGKAITELDKKTGKVFSRVQKGVYSHKLTEKGVKFLLKEKAYGAGQSSWGPSFYGLFDNKDKVLNIKEKLLKEKFFNNAKIFITKAQNSGAKIIKK